MGNRDRGLSHSGASYNAAQNALLNDTWCSTQGYIKLTNKAGWAFTAHGLIFYSTVYRAYSQKTGSDPQGLALILV